MRGTYIVDVQTEEQHWTVAFHKPSSDGSQIYKMMPPDEWGEADAAPRAICLAAVGVVKGEV